MQFNQIRKQIKLLRCNKEEEEEWWFKEEDKDKWEMQEEPSAELSGPESSLNPEVMSLIH